MSPTSTEAIFRPAFNWPRPVPGPVADKMGAAIGRLFYLARLESIYRQINHTQEGQSAFIDAVLKQMGVGWRVSPLELERVPSKGPVVVVANHPYGALEGLILARLLLEARPDVKVMANYMLSRVPELRDLFLLVDPFSSNRAVEQNFRPLRDAVRWLEQGGMLVVFPAGEVSSLAWRRWRVEDPSWSPMAAGMARRAKAKVLPVFFPGRNSVLFQLAGLAHPRLRTALLPRELVNKIGSEISPRIGSPIPYKRLAARGSAREATAYLRRRVYLLGAVKSPRPDDPPEPPAGVMPRPALARPRAAAAEVERLPERQKLMTSGEFTVLYARREQAPHLLDEVGRVRELSFRQVGEGTGRQRDLDRFDDYYLHLCLWNHQEQELAGGYRLGLVDEILAKQGVRGLYTSTLFDYDSEFFARCNPAIELGRSFLDPRYQRSYSGLLLLWKGIGRLIAAMPRYRYILGPVSISNLYSPLSRRLIQEFLDRHFASPLTGLAAPRRPPQWPRPAAKHPLEALSGVEELDELSEIISDIEPSGWGLPILIKQYTKLAAKAVAWNVDPAFGNALDCLMAADLIEADRKYMCRYLGPEGEAAYHRTHLGEELPALSRCA